MPNTGADAVTDIYGNQLDGEFLGDPTNTGAAPRRWAQTTARRIRR